MKLLNTAIKPVNAKLAKALKIPNLAEKYRFASLSMMPDNIVCPASKAAQCRKACLESAGRGVMSNVKAGRQARSDLYHKDPESFAIKLADELEAFNKLCKRQGKIGAVRLNVLSDIAWERRISLDAFDALKFYDYTKRANRLDSVWMPKNYHLTFSYSGVDTYAKQVYEAKFSSANIAAVFRDSLPDEFLGRPVINGDEHDLRFLDPAGVVVGLKAKGNAKQDKTGFVVG
jgi:hypothetical protein